jgi:WD40 repeat protein
MVSEARSPQGTYLARCRDWKVVIWGNGSPQPVRVFANGYRTEVTAVGWSPDERMVVAGSATGEVLAWNVSSEELLLASRYPNHYDPILALSWSSAYDYLAALCASHQIQVWDMYASRCIDVVPCGSAARHLSWSPDGLQLRTDTGERWQLQFSRPSPCCPPSSHGSPFPSF